MEQPKLLPLSFEMLNPGYARINIRFPSFDVVYPEVNLNDISSLPVYSIRNRNSAKRNLKHIQKSLGLTGSNLEMTSESSYLEYGYHSNTYKYNDSLTVTVNNLGGYSIVWSVDYDQDEPPGFLKLV